MVHTSNISSCHKEKKNLFSFPVVVKNSIKIGPLVFLVINVCNHGEHYETPYIYIYIYIYIYMCVCVCVCMCVRVCVCVCVIHLIAYGF